MRRIGTILIGLALLMLPGGCGGPTYVNLPAAEGDLARHDPNSESVRHAQTVALRAVTEKSAYIGPVGVQLIEGTSPLSYVAVLPTIGDEATRLDENADEPEPPVTLTVRAVRLRGGAGEVDVVRGTPEGLRELVTVYLKYAAFGGGWELDRVRTWRGDADSLP